MPTTKINIQKRIAIVFAIVMFLFSNMTNIQAQYEKMIWYFGNQAGLDFTSGTPVPLTNSAMTISDCPASIGHPKFGGILFYSNAEKVWNRNHVIMPNGNGLLGNETAGTSAFAVKQPGSDTLYYLFTIDAFAWANGLRYSIIDMSLNNGLGDVTSVKNVPIFAPSTEKITAVMHANNNDIWIITHPWNSGSFNAYLLNSTGLSTTPVVSTIGSVHAGGTDGCYNALGQMSATPDGSKIVCAIYDLNKYELFDFDRSTGYLSNLITLSGHDKAWGAEFSADGTKLYTTKWFSGEIRQFDISSNNQATITGSAVVIGQATSPSSLYKAGYLQRGPDNKIYVAKFTSPYVGAINNPNLSGLACNYNDTAVHLGGKFCQAGLPTYMQGRSAVSIANIMEDNSIDVYPNPFKSSTIFSYNPQMGFTSIEISDILGRQLHYADIDATETYTFHRNNLPRGVYVYRINKGEKTVLTGKIIVAD